MNFRKQMELADPKSTPNILSNRETLSIDLYNYTAPRAFYDIVTTLAKVHSSVTYPLTQIPNKLKVTDELRRMELIRLANPAQYPIKNILRHDPDSTLYIHIGRGDGELIIERDGAFGSVLLTAKNSYKLPQHQVLGTNMAIRTNGQLSLALDVLEPLPDEVIISRNRIEEFPIKIPPAVRNHRMSFLRGPMSLKETRNRLLFIDIECAHGDEHNPIPISIAAFDFDGFMLMNDLICPRQHVARYGENIHGLAEDNLLGQRDSAESKKDVENMLRGRIIVGHDLHLEHVALPIHLDQIAGVRDLQGSSAVAKIMRSTPGNSWSLSDVARKLGFTAQSRIHSALEDASLIRKIYLKIEKDWEDTPKQQIEELWFQDIGALPVPKTRLAYNTLFRAELMTKRHYDERMKKQREEEEKKKKEEQEKQDQEKEKEKEKFVPPPMPQEYLELGVQLQKQLVPQEEPLASPCIVIMDESSPPSRYATPEPMPESPTNIPGPSTSQRIVITPSTDTKKRAIKRTTPIFGTTSSDTRTVIANTPTSNPQPRSSISQNQTVPGNRQATTKRTSDLDGSSDDDTIQITITKGKKKWCATLRESQ